MASQQTPGIESILSDQEIESIKGAQELYGGQAKLAAIEFAATLGMDPDARQALLGKVAVSIESMDFEARRTLAASFQNVAQCIGGTATGSPRPLPIVPESPQTVNGHETVAALPALGLGSNGDGRRSEETYIDKLTSPQKTWLKKLIGEDHVGSVAALSYRQRLVFAGKLAELYQELRINRLSPEAKAARGEQIIALLSGSSYDEIAREAGASKGALTNGLSNAANGIAARVPLEKLLDLITEAATYSTEQPSEPAGTNPSQTFTGATETIPANEPLTRTQTNWLRKAFGDPFDETEISNLSNPQKEHLAELICRQVRSLFIPKDKSIEKTRRRTQEVEMLVVGHSYEKIAEATRQPLPNLKRELHHIALIFNTHVPEHDRQSIIERAKAYIENGEDE